VVGTPTVRAQDSTPEEAEAARNLFREGRERFAAGDAATAADAFRRALELRPSPQIRYNLAMSLEALSRFVEATDQLRTALRELPPDHPQRAQMDDALARIQPRLGAIVIGLRGELAGAEILLDGRSVSLGVVGVPVPVDPGQHVVTVRASGLETSRSLQIESGQRTPLDLDVPVPAPVAIEPVVPPPPAAAEPVASDPAPLIIPAQPEVRIEAVRPSFERSDPALLIEEPYPVAARTPAAAPAWSFEWGYLIPAGLSLAVGLILDFAPDSARNGALDALDVLPLAFYASTAVFGALAAF
jgi:tetratricopeptide (TPR) repeat protein